MAIVPRLLIVDDEAFNRNLLKRVFSSECEIIEARDGHEALAWLEQNTCDVMLLDIMMPNMSGLEVLEQIRQTLSLVQLPVILVSALAQDEEVACGITLGANDYITKPINIDIVQARVRTQIMLKRATDERHQMMEYFQSANELKLRLMHVASHDLKNPLNNLNMMLALQRDSEDLDSVQSLISIGEGSVKAMQRVIEDFLDMSMFGADGMRLNLTPVHLDEAIQEVISQYAATARQKQIELLPLDINGTVMADERRLMQALSNLVSNAIKYSPPRTRIMFSSEYHSGNWRILVIDQGPGIPAAERATLFDAFQRGSNQPTAGESSTGLGLWIVREMMKLQQGGAGVYCPPEGGSCFWLELPVAQVAIDTENERPALLLAL